MCSVVISFVIKIPLVLVESHEKDLKCQSFICSFSPGEPKGLADEGAYTYSACSQSPGGSWTGVPAAYMGGQASPGGGGSGPTAQGAVTPLSGQQQGGGSTPQGGGAALPSPLYPWMRSQFGELRSNNDDIYFRHPCLYLTCRSFV
jgi:hypothetical protein